MYLTHSSSVGEPLFSCAGLGGAWGPASRGGRLDAMAKELGSHLLQVKATTLHFLHSRNIQMYRLLYPVNTQVTCYAFLAKILMLPDDNDYDYDMNEKLLNTYCERHRLLCCSYSILFHF